MIPYEEDFNKLIAKAQYYALVYGRKKTIKTLKEKRKLLLSQNTSTLKILELKIMIDYLKGKI